MATLKLWKQYANYHLSASKFPNLRHKQLSDVHESTAVVLAYHNMQCRFKCEDYSIKYKLVAYHLAEIPEKSVITQFACL